MALHYFGPGNWLGLPELGLTEKLGGKAESTHAAAVRKGASQSILTSHGVNEGGGGGGGSSWGTNTSLKSSSINPTDGYKTLSNEGDSDDGSGTKEPSQPSLKDLLRNIHEQYAPVLSDIDYRIGLLPGQESEMLGTVESNVQSQQGIVNNALAQGQAGLARNEELAKTSEKSTLRKLAQDVQNLLQAGNMRLGSLGASDSSATAMLNYALAKQGNQRTADVVGQTRNILGEIRNIGEQLKFQAQEKLLQIDQWKAEQTQAVKNYINDIRNQLLDARGNVRMDLSQRNVEELIAEYNYARDRYNQINDYYMQLQDALATDYITRQRNIEDYAKQLELNNRYTGGYVNNYGNIAGLAGNVGNMSNDIGVPINYNYSKEEEDNNYLNNIFGR